jgi:hypothetical protein
MFGSPVACSDAACPYQLGMSSPDVRFLVEICLHFVGGLKSLDKPLVWVFPEVAVCLQCGAARFTVPETELKLIEDNVKTSV